MAREATSPEAEVNGITKSDLIARLAARYPQLVAKDADFAVLSGPPFSTYTHVLETYIDGVKRFDRSKKADWTYQAGGFALPDWFFCMVRRDNQIVEIVNRAHAGEGGFHLFRLGAGKRARIAAHGRFSGRTARH